MPSHPQPAGPPAALFVERPSSSKRTREVVFPSDMVKARRTQHFGDIDDEFARKQISRNFFDPPSKATHTLRNQNELANPHDDQLYDNDDAFVEDHDSVEVIYSDAEVMFLGGREAGRALEHDETMDRPARDFLPWELGGEGRGREGRNSRRSRGAAPVSPATSSSRHQYVASGTLPSTPASGAPNTSPSTT
ncbi:unnamed protein product, partial [Amoebophrya sp. A25]|eukprot:GSA25T00010058001.1